MYQISKDTIEETMDQVKDEFKSEIAELNYLAKYELKLAIEDIAINNPTAKVEAISLAVNTVIKLEKSRSGKELIAKLGMLSDDDIQGLNTLLDNWSIRDALSVLNEIDNRITVIEAIRKLSGDENVDELAVLHPLVTSARWLFGPEYESSEYASNRQLHKVVEIVFGKRISKNSFKNAKKRPDIVMLEDSTASVTGIDTIDYETGMSTLSKILIIELKRGKFKISRSEKFQAQSYVEDFHGCGALIGTPYIDAFVVGDSFDDKANTNINVSNQSNIEIGRVRVTTFSQLVDTAEKRMFGLREKLSERYDDIDGMKLFDQHVQTNLKLA